MPFFVGIALTGLSAGSPISIEVISNEEENYTHSFQEKILDSTNLVSTFEKIASSIPVPFACPVTLSLPSFLSEEERKTTAKAAETVPAFSKIVWTVDNIHIVLTVALNKVPYPPQNELALEIGPDAASVRLISTLVEEDIRETTIEKEIIIRDIGSSDLIAQLVDPALAALKELPTQARSDKYNVIVDDPCLKRVVILDSSPNVVSSLVEQLKAKFRENSPPVEILVESNFAKYAAARSLCQYTASHSDHFVFNVNPLRVGIVKADGFVSTVMERSLSLPHRKRASFTTSKDYQETATIKVVVGITPKAADNTVIAELVLKGLTPRPKGVPRIKVTFDVEQMGKTRIFAKEIVENGASAGSTASIELKDIIGDTMTGRDVDNTYAIFQDFILGKAAKDDAAEESEARWTGKKVQGDLPE
ncbi:hypothetical protein BDZ97DRAFT_1810336 [Flammula alnicola]|nr:hypothetical protein BDZ97DRAFT_1810336 [Flammula alnicola]